jgi:hypothetical protein
MSMRRTWLWLMTLLLLCGPAWAQFDHGYVGWDALLQKHVRWLPDNKQSRVDYNGFKAERAALKKELDAMSAVTPEQFERWPREQQMAFLVNAYNAFTVELILTRWPDLKSIKELGSLLQSPWKKKFFVLLGDERTLDWIEHEQLRPRYKDPRVHAAVNCASIGCPALRPEAFVAPKLQAQFDDGMMRFMADRTRNRFDARRGRLELSKIFDWYGDDFRLGHRGIHSLAGFAALYADLLADAPVDRERIRAQQVDIAFLAYDWTLNDADDTAAPDSGGSA